MLKDLYVLFIADENLNLYKLNSDFSFIKRKVIMASKTITGRRLLYHRGVDDQAGTYVTDYIEAVVCMLLVVTLCIKLISSKGRHHKSTCAVVMVITSISVSALLGGFTHQFLQMVIFYKFVFGINVLYSSDRIKNSYL